MSSNPTKIIYGHAMLHLPGMDGLCVSRAPLEKGPANIFLSDLYQQGKRYGILYEREVGGRNVGSLTYHDSYTALSAHISVDRLNAFFSHKPEAPNDDGTITAFQFPAPEEIGGDLWRHPFGGLWYSQGRGIALAMGLDLPTDEQFLWVARDGSNEGPFFTSSEDPDFRKYVHCSIGSKEIATIDNEDPRYAEQPKLGVKHWVGGSWKWVLRQFGVENKCNDEYVVRGGGFRVENPEVFTPSYRNNNDLDDPDGFVENRGLVCVG